MKEVRVFERCVLQISAREIPSGEIPLAQRIGGQHVRCCA
jgi:hypothetical protein